MRICFCNRLYLKVCENVFEKCGSQSEKEHWVSGMLSKEHGQSNENIESSIA